MCDESRSPVWFIFLNLGSSVPFVAWVSRGLPSTRNPHCTKHMLELLRTTLGSGFCLLYSDPNPRFARGPKPDGGCFWAHEARKQQRDHQTLGQILEIIWQLDQVSVVLLLYVFINTLNKPTTKKHNIAKAFHSIGKHVKKQLEWSLKYLHMYLGWLTIHSDFLLLCWLIANTRVELCHFSATVHLGNNKVISYTNLSQTISQICWF